MGSTVSQVPLTLLSVANNHELLTGVSWTPYWNQQLSNVFLNLELRLRDEDSRFCFGREIQRMSDRILLYNKRNRKWLNEVKKICMWETTTKFLPSPGSTISTVVVSGNSSTAMTGSESWIWKVSEVSNSWSVNIFTFQVAVVWPGLNWTCFWAFPRKSLSCTAVPSTVPMPKKDRYKQKSSVVLLDCS